MEMNMGDVDPNSPFYVLAKGVDPNSPFPVVTIGGNNYNLVPASFLPNPTGQSPYVVDQYYLENNGLSPAQNAQDPTLQIYQYDSSGRLVAVANPQDYLIVPTDFSIGRALAFAGMIQDILPHDYAGGIGVWFQAFKPGGPEDLQRNYDGQKWDINKLMFVPAFQNAASWYYGFVAQESGLGLSVAIGGAKLNAWIKSGPALPQSDINEINAGAAFGTSLGRQGLSTDTVTFASSGASTYNGSAIFPGNTQVTLSGYNDTLNFTGSNSSLTIASTNGTLTLASGSATVNVGQNGIVAQTGNGNNTLTGTIAGLTLDLGSGNNFVGSVAIGTIVNAQNSGVDQFVPSADELITGSTAQDQIVAGNNVLHGAVGQVGSQDPWVVGPNQVKYGFNQQGDLVIQTPYEAAFNNGMTFIQGYVGGPGVPYADQTDGILVSLAKITSSLLIDLTRPFIEDIPDWFKLGNELYYTATGKTIFNADPLVFDLTGGGTGIKPS
jgi:hypothetical protein